MSFFWVCLRRITDRHLGLIARMVGGQKITLIAMGCSNIIEAGVGAGDWQSGVKTVLRYWCVQRL
jgi:hypothetical protein